jgi:O-acetyl-ADP-ribose deacetylase
VLQNAGVNDFVIRLLLPCGKRIEFCGPADITKEITEAIVNAANSTLLGGGGVDGAIHRAGGPSIFKECQRIVAEIRQLPAGRAVMTTGGRLSAKYVIHTVGPVYSGGRRNEPATLASCYRESIKLADDHGVKSLAFPSISTGAYGYPIAEAAPTAVKTVLTSVASATHVQLIRFVLFDLATLNAYTRVAEEFHKLQSPLSFKLEKAS